VKKSKGDDQTNVASNNGDVVKMSDGSGSAGGAVVTPPDKGSAAVVTPPDKGSAAVVTPPDTGSAAVVTPPDNKGSAAVVKPPDNKGSAAPPDNKGSGDKTVVSNTTVKITSNPPGAEIYLDSMATGKKTPQDLILPRKTVRISLKMKGYDDFRKSLSLTAATVTVDAPLKKTVTGPGKGSGSAKKACDTCLERPD